MGSSNPLDRTMIDRLVVVLLPLVSLILVCNFKIVPTFWFLLLLVVEAFIASRLWPEFFAKGWKSLGDRRVQLVVVGGSAFLLILGFSGMTAAVASARDNPENEFGSWGEWLNILMGLPLTVVNTVIAWQLFRVTRVLTLNTVLTELYDSIFSKICPDGRVPDFTPYTSRIATEQVRVVFNRSLNAIKPHELAQLLYSLSQVFALQVIDFNGTAGQHAVTKAGLPVCVPYMDPRVGPVNRVPEAVRFIQLDSLAPLLKGSSLKGGLLEGVDLSWADFEELDFSEGNLRGANFIRSTFLGCRFRHADLRGLRVALSDLELRDAMTAGLQGNPSLWFARFTTCDFTGAIVDQVVLDQLQDMCDEVSRATLAHVVPKENDETQKLQRGMVRLP